MGGVVVEEGIDDGLVVGRRVRTVVEVRQSEAAAEVIEQEEEGQDETRRGGMIFSPLILTWRTC